MSGDYDYLLRMVVKDTRDYERCCARSSYKIKGIRHSRSGVVLRTLKRQIYRCLGCNGGVMNKNSCWRLSSKRQQLSIQ